MYNNAAELLELIARELVERGIDLATEDVCTDCLDSMSDVTKFFVIAHSQEWDRQAEALAFADIAAHYDDPSTDGADEE